MPVVFDEEQLNEKLRNAMEKHRDAKRSGTADDIFMHSIVIDTLQSVRRMHGLPNLTRDWS